MLLLLMCLYTLYTAIHAIHSIFLRQSGSLYCHLVFEICTLQPTQAQLK